MCNSCASLAGLVLSFITCFILLVNRSFNRASLKRFWLNRTPLLSRLSGLPVHNDELNVDILAVFVQEIRHEVRNRFVGDVTAQYDMSVGTHTCTSHGVSRSAFAFSLLTINQGLVVRQVHTLSYPAF